MYRDLVYRPSEDSYGTRDLVFRPGVDATYAETLPYRMSPGPGSGGGIVESRPNDPGISETPTSYDPNEQPLKDFVRNIEETDRKARALLDLYMLGMRGQGGAGNPIAAALLLKDLFPNAQSDIPAERGTPGVIRPGTRQRLKDIFPPRQGGLGVPQGEPGYEMDQQIPWGDLVRGSRGELVAQQFPMSQGDFLDRVERRIDARGPSFEERLRRLGASSVQDAINRGILPAAPRFPGVRPFI